MEISLIFVRQTFFPINLIGEPARHKMISFKRTHSNYGIGGFIKTCLIPSSHVYNNRKHIPLVMEGRRAGYDTKPTT